MNFRELKRLSAIEQDVIALKSAVQALEAIVAELKSAPSGLDVMLDAQKRRETLRLKKPNV